MSGRRRLPAGHRGVQASGSSLTGAVPLVQKFGLPVVVLALAGVMVGWVFTWGGEDSGVRVAEGLPQSAQSQQVTPPDETSVAGVVGSDSSGTDQTAEPSSAPTDRPGGDGENEDPTGEPAGEGTGTPTAGEDGGGGPGGTSAKPTPVKRSTPKQAPAAFSDAAAAIQEYGYSRPGTFAGLRTDAGSRTITVFRRPGDADFDATVRRLADGAVLLLRDAPRSRTELQRLQSDIVRYAESRDILVASTEVPADGGAVLVRVSGDLTEARRVLGARFGSAVRVERGELGALL